MPKKLPITAPLEFETALWQQGCLRVFGLDEAGRGAWAGPVVAAAVCLPHNDPDLGELQGVNDSKQLSPAAREILVLRIRTHTPHWAVGEASSQEIDEHGIVPATLAAMRRAMDKICAADAECIPDHLLLDALRWNYKNTPYTPMIKGDSRSLSIAAASILAKVHRDHLMIELDERYPGYGFADHKGYGTERHQQALDQLGPTPIHRHSFSPIRARLF